MTASTTINYFETWAADRFNLWTHYQMTLRAFTSGLIRGDVLDVGCGSRVFDDLRGAESWTGVDVSDQMLDGLRFYDPVAPEKVTLHRGDIFTLPFADESFDTVCSFFLLHHLGRSNFSETSRRITKGLLQLGWVLRPGGTLIVAENIAGPLELMYHLAYPLTFPVVRRLWNVELPYFLTLKQFRRVAEQARFSECRFVHLKIEDKIFNPVLGLNVPPILSSDPIQKMTLFQLRR